MVQLLERGEVLAHTWVTGELALGHPRGRGETIRLLSHLPQATAAAPAELLPFIERHELTGLGIGYVDAQLLAATRLTDDARLWAGVPGAVTFAGSARRSPPCDPPAGS